MGYKIQFSTDTKAGFYNYKPLWKVDPLEMMECQTADEVSRLGYTCTLHSLSYEREESALENSYICTISLI